MAENTLLVDGSLAISILNPYGKAIFICLETVSIRMKHETLKVNVSYIF